MREARALGLSLGGFDAARDDAGARLAAATPPLARRAWSRADGLRDRRRDARSASRGVRELGAAQIRPLGLEADRLGRPMPADHPYFAALLALGLGRTRWPGDPADAEAPRHGRRNLSRSTPASRRGAWRTGIAASPSRTRARGSASRPCSRWAPRSRSERFLGPFLRARPPALGVLRDDRARRGLGRRGDPHAARAGRRRLDAQRREVASPRNASRADWIVVLGDGRPELGRGGQRAFVVERGTPGPRRLQDREEDGPQGVRVDVVHAARLPRARREPARRRGSTTRARAGFKSAMRTFNATRPMIAAIAVGIGRAALDEALAFAREHDLLGDARVRDRLERDARASCAWRGCSACARPGSPTSSARTSSRRRWQGASRRPSR